MKDNACETRVVALDLRPQRFAFAVFEGAQLLDWGARRFPVNDERALAAVVGNRIRPILRFFAPSVAAIRRMPNHVCSQRRYRIAFESVTGVFRERSIGWSFVDRQEIRRAFAPHGDRTRYEIATRVALWFPELTWKLPPERKFYEGEHSGMIVFDALAVGCTYLARSNPLNITAPD